MCLLASLLLVLSFPYHPSASGLVLKPDADLLLTLSEALFVKKLAVICKTSVGIGEIAKPVNASTTGSAESFSWARPLLKNVWLGAAVVLPDIAGLTEANSSRGRTLQEGGGVICVEVSS